MTREEIINTIKDNIDLNDYGNHIYYTSICDKILLAIKHEKNDLLKEFVEFIEDRLTISIKYENYTANIAEAENDNLRKNMSLLMAETFETIKNCMKPALKEFLKEKNENTRR